MFIGHKWFILIMDNNIQLSTRFIYEMDAIASTLLSGMPVASISLYECKASFHYTKAQ